MAKKHRNFYRQSQALTSNLTNVHWGKKKAGWNTPSSLTDYKNSEAYLQHWLFHKLQLEKIDSIPEFRELGNRYDLVVLKQGRPICIVELKARWTEAECAEGQLKRYEKNSWKVPVFLLAGAEQGKFIFSQILKIYRANASPF